LYPTGRYMKNAFRGIGKKAALKKRREEKNNKKSDS